MKMMNAKLSLVFALLSLVLCRTTVAQQQPDNVQGNWTIYSTSIKNGETVEKHVQLAQYGNHLTGYFEGPDQSGPIQGEVNGHHIRFSTVTRTVINFHGQIFGDTMSGEYGIHGKHAPWQAVRPSTATAPVAPATGVVYASQLELASPPPVAPAPAPVAQPASYPTTQVSSGPAPAPLSASQLDSLVAPIALYPDALVAQVLAASTNPQQVAYADDWLAQNKNLTSTAVTQAVDQQSWDPSVKALTQFPSVMDNLAHNLSWTSSLGQAFANQQADVMAAVQAMRARAQAAGTLQSNAQITVTQPASNTIVIQPANSQVVYVPQYNPAIVYGAPVVVPWYVAPPVPVASVGLFFGNGISVGAVFGGGGWGGGFGWGWHAWNVSWGGGGSTIIYNNNTYINNHVWNNNNYNGYHPWANGVAGSQNHAYYANNGTFHPNANYRPGTDTHYGPNGAYHPNGYYGPDGGWHPGPVNHAGGATGSENTGYYGANGTYHPVAGYKPGEDTHYGPNGAYHPNEYFGPDGGLHPDKPGTNPANQPNGGNNDNHGLIGGNGGVQNPNAGQNGTLGTQHTAKQQATSSRDNNRLGGGEQNRSHWSGDGSRSRAESNRGHNSMAHRAPQHEAHMHAPAAHHSGGGGGHRR
ncbi:MAG: DUF3300 domain-containing protein [Candidatus Korobacteraceae bacterium]|jgi:hypothetical protein